ncbi:hypothetical protein CEXT_177711 [Caerostris extrusa]|uniref:Uncharacterized protein n=1 Tax=Caerostris extrusa TaxID=172846 RepID=A0AAV4R1X0_CAEEX|nr:hypothetical protein CEXT_177711 [Caerostris extrusa]
MNVITAYIDTQMTFTYECHLFISAVMNVITADDQKGVNVKQISQWLGILWTEEETLYTGNWSTNFGMGNT